VKVITISNTSLLSTTTPVVHEDASYTKSSRRFGGNTLTKGEIIFYIFSNSTH